MSNLSQAINGELLKGEVKLSEVLRASDFFKSDLGSHYTLQFSGNFNKEENSDEYGLHDNYGNVMGYIDDNQMVEYTVDCAKNISKVRICGLWLHPYKNVPVKLQFLTVE